MLININMKNNHLKEQEMNIYSVCIRKAKAKTKFAHYLLNPRSMRQFTLQPTQDFPSLQPRHGFATHFPNVQFNVNLRPCKNMCVVSNATLLLFLEKSNDLFFRFLKKACLG